MTSAGERRARHLPALRFDALAWAYEPIAMRLVRAAEWRAAVVDAVAPAPGERILDLGCGTGSLCVRLKARCPAATVIGVDPDAAMLDRARAQAEAAGVDPVFLAASATNLPHDPPLDRPFDACLSTLMFHHLEPAGKRAALAEALRLLKPGGRLVIADWGPPRTAAGRLGFLVTQLFDGFATTRDHATEDFPAMLAAEGLNGPVETARWATPVGVLCLYAGTRRAVG